MLKIGKGMKRTKLRMRFGSHLPVLMRVMELTDGPVLELGAGLFSTPFLHWACFRTERELVTMEHHPVYWEEFRQYEREWHRVLWAEDWDEMRVEREGKGWSVVLVDHDPLERRSVETRRVKDCAEYVVFHDATDPARERCDYEGAWREYRWRYLFNKVGAPSMILSNTHDLGGFHV